MTKEKYNLRKIGKVISTGLVGLIGAGVILSTSSCVATSQRCYFPKDAKVNYEECINYKCNRSKEKDNYSEWISNNWGDGGSGDSGGTGGDSGGASGGAGGSGQGGN